MNIKKYLKVVLMPLLQTKLAKWLFIRHFYRDIVSAGQLGQSLRKSKTELDEYYWAGRLRKYAHMIDKGLQREDFTCGHSSHIYIEAREIIKNIHSQDVLNDPSVKWSLSKIEEYESLQVTGDHHLYPGEYEITKCKPEDILDVIKTRRSIRRYKEKPVDDETLNMIVDVINWCPTSCNRQTAKVFASNNPDIVRKCMQNCSGASGFGHYIPLFICYCSDICIYDMPLEITLPYIDVALGIQNCNLMAHCLGISLTMLTWAQHTKQQERALREILGIPKRYQILVNSAGGYPLCGAPVPARKSHESTILIRK